MSGDFRFISYEQHERVVVVTIRRPEVLNALHMEAHRELEQAWSRFEADDSAWVAILTGQGERAFCAGADLKEASGQASPQRYWMTLKPGGFGGLTERFSMVKPVIGAVNGYAMGGGFELALACDIIVAAEHARFALPEPRVGVMASDGGVHRIVRQLPLKIGMGLLLTGRQLTAPEAHAWGLVNAVVPGHDLLDRAREWADEVLACAPLSVRASKQAAMAGLDLPLPDAINRRYEGILRWAKAEDTLEGPRAFVEKRKPQWTGR
jgi:enoyl-CoA hydratase/carnithine racemase